MNIYKIPQNLKVLLFDIDSTLYRHDEYYDLQETLLVKRLAESNGLDYSAMQEKIHNYRNNFTENNSGKKISLGNTFTAFGCSIAQNAEWRRELFKPQNYLTKDTILGKLLKSLQKKYRITALTNNHTEIGYKTLKALGVDDLFELIIGLDMTLASKPNKQVYNKYLEELNELPENVLSIGDRYSVDIEKPLELGMGGILVDNMEDIYSLVNII